MARLAVLLLAFAAASCSLFGTKLEVTGDGTFQCGNAFHGCIAWFVVRPTDWARPANWAPGRNDGQFPTTPDHRGTWVVAGRPIGGPSFLQPGEYSFSILYSEVDDTRSLVLGTDEQATTGLLKTTLECTATFVVDRADAVLEIHATFGDDCSVEIQPEPRP
jgi:hypothetical protein